MRKPRGFLARAFAATIAIWLGTVLTEPLPLDACAMHGTAGMHGMMSAHSMPSHDSRGDASRKAGHQCSCIGDCTAGAGSFALRSEHVDGLRTVVTAYVRAPNPAAASFRPAPFDHRLPPANGPPSIS